MIVNVSAKSITLLLAVGVASTTGSNLRQRRTTLFGHSHQDEGKSAPSSVAASSTVVTKQTTNLRGSPTDTSDDYAKAAAAAEQPVVDAAATPKESASTLSESTSISSEPSLTLPKSTYAESESITVHVSVGSPSHPYYSSSSVPTLNLDYHFAEWSVGLFMRDADPQGGTLSPIVSVNLCAALGEGCDATNTDWRTYGDLSITFGDENLALMHGKWPLHVSDYGTGFDAYVLDANGAGAIGPLEFYIQDGDYSDDVNNVQPAHYGPNNSEQTSSTSSHIPSPGHSSTKKSGLVKYSKGTKKASERQHAQVSKATYINKAVKANTKIVESNGLEMSSNALPASGTIHKTSTLSEESEFADAQQGPSKDSITSNKDKYESDDEVSINFNIDTSSHKDLSNYKIGIFMRMAHPQGGALDPVVSLPITTTHGSSSIPGVASGSVTFSSETMEDLLIGTWPIDLYQWGTGFDAYVLDESGDDVVGPVKFNIMMNDTY